MRNSKILKKLTCIKSARLGCDCKSTRGNATCDVRQSENHVWRQRKPHVAGSNLFRVFMRPTQSNSLPLRKKYKNSKQ